MKRKSLLRRSIWAILILFVLLNVVAFFHAYKFTHFADKAVEKTKDPKNLSLGQKVATLFLGVNNPKPVNNQFPAGEFETVHLQSNKELEYWWIKGDSTKGTVVLFHGYGGEKSSMLDKAAVFQRLGYNTLLVDFMGSGGSEGNQTTIGYFEAEQVKRCYEYLQKKGEQHMYLFGTSMGAVAIMKAINDYPITPKGIILECPFGSMYQTVCARFKTMHAPTFPLAGLLVFWGGVQNGFWAFGHNPRDYAKEITCPTLLLYGAQDEKVSREEIEEIYANLKGAEMLKVYPHAGHENFVTKYQREWTQDIKAFMTTH